MERETYGPPPEGPEPTAPAWACRTCAVEYPASDEPPRVCVICADERQYVRPSGQRWTTLAELGREGVRATVEEVEPGLHGITTQPKVGIGQRSLLVQTRDGNLLWDPIGYVDDDLEQVVRDLGGIDAVASSHPHMFGVQVAWGDRFDAPVLVQERDRQWVQRTSPRIRTWAEEVEVLPGVTLHRIGGHFPGSAVARFAGADGRGVLLTGDTVMGTPDQRRVSFMYSYPNLLPLSAASVRTLADRVLTLDFDRLYDNFGGAVLTEGSTSVRHSADRYASWVGGELDHLTD